jgi:hypothetical protein
MWPFTTKCRDCKCTISRLTAKKAFGRCPDCHALAAKRDAEFKRKFDAEKLAHQRRLETGEVYRPSATELDSAMTPAEFNSSGCQWMLQPEFYSGYNDGQITTIDEAISDAESRIDGVLFLVSNLDGQLNLGISSKYGVCEYINEQYGHWLYAYTDNNLEEQVEERYHVVQTCPCCGVEMLWYPSRFHFPRIQALDLVRRVSRCESPNNLSWLDSGDFSFTERGRG